MRNSTFNGLAKLLMVDDWRLQIEILWEDMPRHIEQVLLESDEATVNVQFTVAPTPFSSKEHNGFCSTTPMSMAEGTPRHNAQSPTDSILLPVEEALMALIPAPPGRHGLRTRLLDLVPLLPMDVPQETLHNINILSRLEDPSIHTADAIEYAAQAARRVKQWAKEQLKKEVE